MNPNWSDIVAGGIEFSGDPRFVLFIGTPRSGHSIIGAILDSHRSAVVSHEVNALEKVSQGLGRKDLLSAIIENSRAQALAGRSQSDADHAAGYGQQLSGEGDEAYSQRLANLPTPDSYRFDYAIPGHFQGRTEGGIRVIGDKKGGGTTKMLAQDSTLLKRFEKIVEMPIDLIHVIRDPYDNISTMARRTGTRVSRQVSRYEWLCEQIGLVLDSCDNRVFHIHHEDFVSSPSRVIEDLFTWLGLSLESDHIAACSSIVYEKPHRSRLLSDWEDGDKDSVESMIERWEFLREYQSDGSHASV